MTDRVQICNAALGLAGSNIVLESFDQDGEAARSCRIHYPTLVSALLRATDWNFASRVTPLAPHDGIGGFTNLFFEQESYWLQPADSIRLMDVYDSNKRRVEFRIGDRSEDNRQILIVDAASAVSPLYIRYTFDALPSVWPADFQQGVQFLLASRLLSHLRTSETPEASEKLREIGEQMITIASQVNDSEGSNLFASTNSVSLVQERALSLAGARTERGRAFGSTSGEQRVIEQFWDLDRKSFLMNGEMPFNRRYIDLEPLIPQPMNEPSSAGYLPFYYEYPGDPCILKLQNTWLRYTEYEMYEAPWTVIDKGPPIGKWILLNSGWAQGVRADVRVTALFIIDEPNLDLWTPPAQLGMSYKLAMSLAATLGKPLPFIQALERNMREHVAKARATSLQELGQRSTETFPKTSRYVEGRR